MTAIADRRARGGDPGYEVFAAANPDLLGPSRAFLLSYYSAATLDGDLARCQFLLPERLPLDGTTGLGAAGGSASGRYRRSRREPTVGFGQRTRSSQVGVDPRRRR